ncbi:MAG: winged helix-turn-helix domain-containing protein [Methanosarcina sp.]|uniref:helix-turn-helix transcriptional regulator n=1 Tax=Methanosarcina sp. TaxID=2213 RepID=UPI00262A7418|nr:winged helix-turn-helix domain-containing protein [Methanosarcina sp.]MDD3247029.1 winged helix-turn-helix domain-containing protein [Methanosarcina sp.]MDD4248737.1 winged helix-turn-helix domain-containing protein [Methanosarcina sp.]
MSHVSDASSSLLDAIFLSEKRKNLLLLLKEEGPKSSEEIKNAFDFPWKSMIPQIKKLVDLGLVIQKDGVYSLSEMGIVIATNVQFLLNILKIYGENRDFWSEHDLSSIPFHLLTRIGELGQCKVLKPDLSHIFKVQEDIVKCMLASSRIMVFVSAIHPAYHLLCLGFIEKGIDVTIILTESVFESIQDECLSESSTFFSDSSVLKLDLPEYKKEVQFFLNCENSHFFVSDGEKKPMMLIVTDKIFALSLLDKNGRVDRHYIVSFEPGALKWGEELFTYYKKNSRQTFSL